MNRVLLTGTIFDKSIFYEQGDQNKSSLLKFNFAVANSYKDKKTDKYGTSYLPCVAWGRTADFIHRNFTKGQAMEITSAELRNNSYTNKKGDKVFETVVYVEQVTYAPRNYVRQTPQPEYTHEEQSVYPTDEEIAELMKFQAEIPTFFSNNEE